MSQSQFKNIKNMWNKKYNIFSKDFWIDDIFDKNFWIYKGCCIGGIAIMIFTICFFHKDDKRQDCDCDCNIIIEE